MEKQEEEQVGSIAVGVPPSAARLTNSLRDIGYDFPSAVADLVDNSVAADATRIEIDIEYAGAETRVMIADDGSGMTANGVAEALRFGSRRDYRLGDLGRYGLGLNTASLSQCRKLTVLSRAGTRNVTVRQLSLDVIEKFDDWLIVEPLPSPTYAEARRLLGSSTGTVVVWEQLDRVFQEQKPEGGWARRRVEKLADRVADHLALVFHRFLEGAGVRRLNILVNGKKVRPWNPFALKEPATIELPRQEFEVSVRDVTGRVSLQRYVLPSRNAFSTPSEFERLSGPLKWNRQQGLYIYRANRLVQWGGWGGLRGIDEHLKLARAALDFDTDLDEVFNINVAKMRVSIPTQLRPMLEKPIHDLCIRADDVYRRAALKKSSRERAQPAARKADGAMALLAIRAAAMAVGETDALRRILQQLALTAPETAEALGLVLPQEEAG